jgi:hypothetical protein
MANNRDDDLTIRIKGIQVKGRVLTDLDSGKSRWYPYDGPNYDLSSNIYLESKQNADGTWSGWIGSGNVFNELRYRNTSLAAAYSTKEALATAFYSAGTGVGSPTGQLNDGRLGQFNNHGAPQKAKTLGIPGAGNTASPDEPDLNQQPATEPLTTTNEDINKLTNKIISDPRESTVKARLSAINARYPEDISTKQDTILFRLKEIIGRDFTGTQPKDANFTFGTKSLSQPFGSVVLPIQPSITDSNSVDWGNPTLDPLSAFAGRASLAMQTSDQIIQEVGNQAKIAAKEFKTNYGAYASALHLFLAQEAIGAQGLFSRGTGAVLNPNLELLFTGPSLRPFNFTFRLSPRSESEAKKVKEIIYFFKAGMATRRANTAVFLKAPYVFSIQYQTGTSDKGLEPHKSLNRIKECALLSCDVDYTPDGTYMTFNDEEKTMTSYQLTLRFSELDPVYNTDYVDSHPIGY